MKTEQLTQHETKPIMFVEKDISEEELNKKASFSLLWPTYLPEGFPFQRIGGLSLNGDQPVLSSDFLLNYGTGIDKWLTIVQSVSMKNTNLSSYQLLDKIPVMGEITPIYEKVRDKEGPFTSLYFEKGDVVINVQAVGMSTAEMLSVISGLQTK